STGVEGGAVEHVHERGAALDVAQELKSQPLALAGTLDEAGHVGDRVAALAGLHDAEVGMQGRERVIRDLRLRRRHGRDEARLARRRVPDEGDVRDDLELEEDVSLPAWGAEQREAGGL